MSFNTPSYFYTFLFPDKRELSFSISLDSASRQNKIGSNAPPEWSHLAHHQCSPCTLNAATHPFCPVALSIVELVTAFKDTASCAACKVTCHSPQRTVFKETVVQEGLASIFGLLMATSGCPVMDFFRPLARFHLPFANVEESIFRVAAAYMLQQYYRNEHNRQDQFTLDDIKSHYAAVKQVNKGILERILDITELDADKNALVTLSSLAQILEIELDENLESLQSLFNEK